MTIDEAGCKLMKQALQIVADKIVYGDVVAHIHEHGSGRTHLSIVSYMNGLIAAIIMPKRRRLQACDA